MNKVEQRTGVETSLPIEKDSGIEDLKRVFGKYGWLERTFELLKRKEFGIGEVDGQELLVWPGHEADAEALFDLFFLDGQGEHVDWSRMTDDDYRRLLYGDEKSEIADYVHQTKLGQFFLRQGSIFASMPQITNNGCQMTPLEHIVQTPRYIETISTADLPISIYTNIVAYFVAIAHDFGKVVDPTNGDHDTVGAEMARTLLFLMKKLIVSKRINLGFIFDEQFIEHVVAVIQVHHFSGRTTKKSIREAEEKQIPFDETASDIYGWSEWQKIVKNIKDMMKELEIKVKFNFGQIQELFSLSHYLQLMLDRCQRLQFDLGLAFDELTSYGGYAELACAYDHRYQSNLRAIMMTVNTHMVRLQALVLLTQADLKCSDKPEELLEKYRQETLVGLWGMLVSIDGFIQNLFIEEAGIWMG